MAKLTILYGHPKDPGAFEDYYANKHLPVTQTLPDQPERFELSRVVGTLDGGEAPFYRVAEMWYPDVETLRAAFGSEEGQAVVSDMENFATGGATLLIADSDQSS